jgi:5-methyltetrahydrofolate--homocysteine methyltransferase
VVVVLLCVLATDRTSGADSVSGFYLAHPEAAYFNVGRIGEDQIADWARRMAMEEGEARRALASVV